MITSKAYMLKIMKKCKYANTLTREEKFQVFCNVCDNMLKEGRMTKATANAVDLGSFDRDLINFLVLY